MLSSGEMRRRKRRIDGVTWVMSAIVTVCSDCRCRRQGVRRTDHLVGHLPGGITHPIARLMRRPFDVAFFAHLCRDRCRWDVGRPGSGLVLQNTQRRTEDAVRLPFWVVVVLSTRRLPVRVPAQAVYITVKVQALSQPELPHFLEMEVHVSAC